MSMPPLEPDAGSEPCINAIRTRLLLVDDHYFVRMGLSASINRETDLKVVAEAQNGAEALALYAEHRPDVVIMDGRLPDRPGTEVLMAIRSADPGARVVMLSIDETEEDVHRAMEGGALGYLGKSAPWEMLLAAIRSAAQGRTYLPPALAAHLAARRHRRPLSPRELDILRLVIKGQPNKLIADALGIAEMTVKVHLSHIFYKLEVNDRVSAVAIAVQRGLVRME